eukprot:57178-Chlamydomonas_euryale.AAC.2
MRACAGEAAVPAWGGRGRQTATGRYRAVVIVCCSCCVAAVRGASASLQQAHIERPVACPYATDADGSSHGFNLHCRHAHGVALDGSLFWVFPVVQAIL